MTNFKTNDTVLFQETRGPRQGEWTEGVITRLRGQEAKVVRPDGSSTKRLLSALQAPEGSEAHSRHEQAQKVDWTVEQRFDFLRVAVQRVAQGHVPSLLVTGSGGLGKTHEVRAALAELGMHKGADYVTITGAVTARGLYELLFNHQDGFIVFDDADDFLTDERSRNLLKGALDSHENREISWYRDSTKDSDIPDSFEFRGSVIFISNRELEDVPQTLRSRSLQVDVSLTTEERLDRLTQILPHVEATVPMETREAALALVREWAPLIRDINVRTLVNTIRVARGGGNWRDLAAYLLTQS